MQDTFRYFTNFKIAIISIVICNFAELSALCKRNPFCFSDPTINVSFSYRAIAKVHNCSKSAAILSYNDRSPSAQKIIAYKGDIVRGYKIVDILDDMIIIQDDKNNEIILPLK